MNDKPQRIKALDPHQSFIVQAPAGSGKTQLLTQRFLKLLKEVKSPEEILAVTFTRKASSEMRQRIVSALKSALGEAPTKDHEKLTYTLAQNVLEVDRLYGWDLINYPNRLRIMTIDAVCSYVANRMPVLSMMGSAPEIIDYPNEYYREAIERLLKETVKEDRWSNALEQILLHLDNRMALIVDLLENMLAKRDQWLPYLGELMQQDTSLLHYVNQGIATIIELHLNRLERMLQSDVKEQIASLLSYAKTNLLNQPIKVTFSSSIADKLSLWVDIAELLLTKDNTWRKKFTIQNGFPSPSDSKEREEKQQRKAYKEAIAQLIESLSCNQKLLALLGETRLLPLNHMSKEQSSILNAMGTILPLLVAHLQVIFQEKGKIDFVEVNLRALNAMGDELTPTDITLSLDYQIKHILIDEYQDTSISQYRLFEKLTMGWQKGDGKTLFLVGDPMQSIYKFRGAEVSLFMKTQAKGLGGVSLVPLTLSSNFRSNANVVEWINGAFVEIFPKEDELTLGGVKYEQAIAQQSALENAVTVHLAENESHEATLVIDIIQATLNAKPQDSIAVLVRAKRHLSEIVDKLKRLRLPFVALEVEHLGSRMHVTDLLTLLRAVHDWTDKVAWFALLRAPWLGLSLADLLLIADSAKNDLVFKAINEFEAIPNLSSDAKERLRKFVPLLNYYLNERSANEWSKYLRALWVSIGAPSCYGEPHLLNDIDKILTLIETYGILHGSIDVDEIERRVAQLYADISFSKNTHSQNEPHIELMTIHKAKGLEFDTVILPRLQAKTKNHETSLILWYEHAHENGIDLILSPRKAYKDTNEPLSRFVESQLKRKSEFESARLLYVAATRAKKHLHFVATVENEEDSEITYKPPKGSFLQLLWPHVTLPAVQVGLCQIKHNAVKDLLVKRLKLCTALPLKIQAALDDIQSKKPKADNIPPASDIIAQAAGTVFHRFMQRTQPWQLPKKETIVLSLKRFGLSGSMLEQATVLVEQGIKNMLDCDKGKWILSQAHVMRKSEWHLTLKTKQGTENIILDCAFIDNQHNRWIIDYKLTHQTVFNEETLAIEADKYRPQLLKYKNALQLLEGNVVRCALYFPMAQLFYEYDF